MTLPADFPRRGSVDTQGRGSWTRTPTLGSLSLFLGPPSNSDKIAHSLARLCFLISFSKQVIHLVKLLKKEND